MDVSNWIALVAVVISVIGGLFSFFNNRKLNIQQKQINDIILAKEEKEKNNQKKAFIEASCIPHKGQSTVMVYNKGNAIAHNIRIEFPYDEKDGLLFRNLPFPYPQMNPQAQGTEFCINLNSGHVNPVHIKFIWDDEFANNNEMTQILTL